MTKLRIAMGGIRHETNSFSPILTGYRDFNMKRGEAILSDELRQIAHRHKAALYPTFVAGAMPNGLVRQAAYERLKTELLAELQATLPLDGVYLDLHGAMEVEAVGDGEGDLVTAVRRLIGPETLISVSLDLHGNISPTLVDQADILTAFRTAPHRDYEETRQRALALLGRALQEGLKPEAVLIKPPILLSGEAAVTERDPAQTLYARLPEIAQIPGIMDASLLIGCAWTDSVYTSTSVIVIAERNRTLARQEAAKLAQMIWNQRQDFDFGVETAPVDEAIRRAMTAVERPVFISDSGDNVTAGAAGDIPYLAERLLALNAETAVVAGLTDAAAVQHCAAAGLGQIVTLSIGGKLDPANGQPLAVRGQVMHLASEAGLAVVRVEGVSLILTEERRAFTTRASIAAAGLDPMQQQVVVVKLGYLFPDLIDHVPRAIMALSPGATSLQLETLPYQHLSRPIFPLDPDLAWAPPL